MGAVQPFVVYSSCSEALVPGEDWPTLYASLQALKAHVQEYPGCQRFDAFADVLEDGVWVHVYTTWDTPDQLEVYLERGYTFERMLADVGVPAVERTLVMEKLF